ncbi:MAG: tetratricopeptide repeat protein [Bernardetiaceae bacterium]|nr:tetratricopeptide repeat protein [Bernardetiaceae bacterium]
MAKTRTSKSSPKGKKQAQSSEDLDSNFDALANSDEVLRDSVSKTEDFVSQNRNVLIGGVVAIFLIVAAVFGYNWYVQKQSKEAQAKIFPAVFYFEKDSLNKALMGDGNQAEGLKSIAENYSMTATGDLASFYVGVSKLKLGEYDEAIAALKKFSAKDLLVQARAFSLIGDAYGEKEDWKAASEYYEKAANYNPNEQFTPDYLAKLAFAQEQNKEYSKAVATYDKLLKKYPKARQAPRMKKEKARLEQLAQAN